MFKKEVSTDLALSGLDLGPSICAPPKPVEPFRTASEENITVAVGAFTVQQETQALAHHIL